MGRMPVRTREYDLVQLQDNHRAAIRMMALGASNEEVGKALGLGMLAVTTIRNSPLTRAEIERLQGALNANVERVRERIVSLQGEAVEKVYELMYHAHKDEVQLKAAERLLDMGGNSRVQKIEANVNHSHLSRNEIEEIKQRALSAWKRAKDTVDIVAEEVQ